MWQCGNLEGEKQMVIREQTKFDINVTEKVSRNNVLRLLDLRELSFMILRGIIK